MGASPGGLLGRTKGEEHIFHGTKLRRKAREKLRNAFCI